MCIGCAMWGGIFISSIVNNNKELYKDQYNKEYGKHLRKIRKDVGITQEELGFRSGVHPTYISDLERGLKSPTIAVIQRIAHALNVSIIEFFVDTLPSRIDRVSSPSETYHVCQMPSHDCKYCKHENDISNDVSTYDNHKADILNHVSANHNQQTATNNHESTADTTSHESTIGKR